MVAGAYRAGSDDGINHVSSGWHKPGRTEIRVDLRQTFETRNAVSADCSAMTCG